MNMSIRYKVYDILLFIVILDPHELLHIIPFFLKRSHELALDFNKII